jgi:hypothetical protein
MKCFFIHKDKRIIKVNLKPDDNDEVDYKQGKYCIHKNGTFLYTDDGKKFEIASYWTVGNPLPHTFNEVNKGMPSKVLGAIMEPRIWRMLSKGDDHPYLVGIIVLNVIIIVLGIVTLVAAYGNPLT